MHRDWMKPGLIASFFADFAQCGLMPGFSAVAAPLSEEPFILRVVMDKAHGLILAGEQVEQNGPAAFDKLFRGVLRRGVW